MEVKIINTSSNPLPRYESEQAAGMDIRTSITEPITLKSLERKLFPTGLFIELPTGYEAQIRPRSGMALKRGITVLNTPGTVDADYRGEICVILINLGAEDFTVADGDRICQMLVKSYDHVEWEPVEELDRTKREDGGFGHTGEK